MTIDTRFRAPAWQAGLALLALLLFAAAIHRQPFPNEDGALYLLVADRIGQQGLSGAFALFDRPFYSALIAGVHALTGLALQPSAWLLGAVFAVVMTLAFVELCALFCNDARILPCAALVLLAHPRINNYFAFLVRDPGYWACLLTAWVLFLRHLQEGRWRTLVGWALLSVLAACFKPEGLAFAALLPLALLTDRRPWRWRLTHLAVAGGIFVAPLLLAVAWRSDVSLAGLVATLHERPLQSLQGVPNAFFAASERFAEHVLPPDSRNMAPVAYAGALLALLLAKLLNAVGLLQLLLAGYAWRARDAAIAEGRRVAWALLLFTAVLLPGLFLAYQGFMDNRYLMLACLLLFVPAARGLQLLVERLRRRGGAAGVAGIALLLALFAADFGLGLDRGKPYMQQTYDWIRANVPEGTAVFTNDRQFAAASRGPWDSREVDSANELLRLGQARMDDGRVWIIHVKPAETGVLRSMERYGAGLQLQARFTGARGEQVLVWRPVVPHAAQSTATPAGSAASVAEPSHGP